MTKDHPRRCGENYKVTVAFFKTSGSPPQVRGKQTATDYDPYLHGITPAGAGKTFVPTACGHYAQDHPRRCGENNRDRT